MAAGVVIRYFKRNDQGNKNLWLRQVKEALTIEEALAFAYHTVAKSPAELKAQILSVEIESRNGAQITQAAGAQADARSR